MGSTHIANGSSPTEVCLAYLAAFADGDPDAIAGLVTDDFINEHTAALGSGCIGRAEYASRLGGFLASMPDLRYEIVDTVADRDRVVVAYVLHATPGGRAVAVPGVMRFLVRDGLIATRTDYWDSLVFQRQAGLA